MLFYKKIQNTATHHASTSYFLQGSAWLFGAHMLNSAIAIIVTVVITRMLPLETFGQYRFILTLIPLFALATIPGTAQTLIRSTAAGNHISLISIALRKIQWGLIGSLFSLILALYYLLQGNNIFAITFVVAAVFIPLYESFFVYSSYYKGKQLFKTSAAYDVIARAVYASTMIVTVLLTRNIIIIVTAFLFSHTAIRFILLWWTYKKNPKNTRNPTPNDTAKYDDTIDYGKKISLGIFLEVFASHIDKILIWYFLGARVLALYIVALLVATELARGLNTIATVILPKLVTKDIHTNSYSYGIYIAIILSVATATYALLISPFIHSFFPAYIQIIPIAYVASALILLIPLRKLLDTILVTRHAARAIVTFQAVDALFALSFIYIILTYTNYGITGVLVVILTKTFFVIALQILHVRRTQLD